MAVLLEANSLLSRGVESINQPLPLASSSMKIVPALGIPEASKLVICASASCPLGRLVIWNVILRGVSGLSKSDQILVAIVLRLLII